MQGVVEICVPKVGAGGRGPGINLFKWQKCKNKSKHVCCEMARTIALSGSQKNGEFFAA
jgi:hypothetical protein